MYSVLLIVALVIALAALDVTAWLHAAASGHATHVGKEARRA